MPRVVHFEIHADDLDRAERFYTDVFGWTIQRWQGPFDYRVVTTGNDGEPGINGALVGRRGPIDGQAVTAYVCTVDVPDIVETEQRVAAAGGRQVVERTIVPHVGHLSYFKDTEGNIFGAMEDDPDAGEAA
jgi:predicted enzyme related to lactoylglutathione lyase